MLYALRFASYRDQNFKLRAYNHLNITEFNSVSFSLARCFYGPKFTLILCLQNIAVLFRK